MLWSVGRRVAIAVLTLLLASLVVFAAVHALPGGPATALSADGSSPRVVAATAQQYGFNKPLIVQYGIWVSQAARGHLGTSPITDLPVSTQIAQRIPITAELALLSLLIAIVIGIPAGVLAAVRPGGIWDYVASATALGGLSIPHFWFGILLILLFAVHLHVLPSGGFVPLSQGVGGNLEHMLLPAVVIGTGLAAVLMRQTRAAMLESLGADYVRTARAKGLPEWKIVGIHALRNSLITVVTVLGLQLGGLIAGIVTVEEVFDIPGIGQLTLDAVSQRDYSTLQGVILLIAGTYIVANLLVDLAYTLINPRVRVAGSARVTATTAGLALAPGRRRMLLPFGGRPLALIGAAGAFIVVFLAIFGPLLAPANPVTSNFNEVLAPPLSAHHLLGTDQLGRDVLSRLLYGARTTLEAGVFSTLLATAIGMPIGVVSGYFRGAVDVIIMRLIDVMLAFPFLLLAVGLAAISGPSLWNAVLALGIAQVPAVARIARGETLAVRELEYVQAAVVNGETDTAIMRRHVMPNVLSPVIVQTTVAIPGSIVGAAILSFLGLGVQPPTADWGAMLAQAEGYLNQSVWLGIFPGLAIFFAALSFNLLGDGVRDALDPRRRGR